jgi:hypothetical protein
LKVSDVFTAFYSSILATAAVADAKIKEDRRKQWDRAIAEVKGTTSWSDSESLPHAELPEIKTSSARTSLADCNLRGKEPGWATLKPTLDGGMKVRVPGIGFETRLRVLDSEIQKSYSQPVKTRPEDGNEASIPLGRSEAWYEEPDEILWEREPKTMEHLEWRQGAISRMVEKFLLMVVQSVKKGATGHKPRRVHPELKDMIISIQTLRSGYTKLPVYSWEGLRIVDRGRYELHRSLHELFTSANSGDPSSIELLLTKICYNLLVSTTPPSVITYNILLRELTRLQQHDVAQIVVDSYFFDTIFKPNHNTSVLLLEHYAAKGDPHGWRSVKDRLRAPNANPKYSMRTRKRHVDLLAWRPKLQKWVLNNRIVQKGPFLIEKFPRDIRVFDALIKGALKFNGATNAVYYIRQALAESQRVYSETLCSVIKSCLKEQNVNASVSLLRSILSTLWNEDAEASAIIFTRALRYCLYQLFHMCGIETILGPQAYLPQDLRADMVQSMLRKMRIASVEDAVCRAEEYIETLELHLEANRYPYMVRDGFGERPADKDTGSAPLEMSRLSISDHPRAEEALDLNKPVNISPEGDEKSLLYDKYNLKWLSIREKLDAKARRRNKNRGHRRRLELVDSNLTNVGDSITAIEEQLIPIALSALSRDLQMYYLRWASQFDNSHCKDGFHGRLDKLVHLLQHCEIPSMMQEQSADVQALPIEDFRKEAQSTSTGLDLRLEMAVKGVGTMDVISVLQKQILRCGQQLHQIEAQIRKTHLLILDKWVSRMRHQIHLTGSFVLAELRKIRNSTRRDNLLKDLTEKLYRSGQRIDSFEADLVKISKPGRVRVRHLEKVMRSGNNILSDQLRTEQSTPSPVIPLGIYP